jgi:arsenate reductase-like glutaredoxin family protein
MLVEWLSKTQEELRTHVNKEVPEIAKLNMQLQFIEERMIDVEMLIDKIRQNGISHD